MSEWPIGTGPDAGHAADRDIRFDQPPAGSGRERRAHARAFRYWEQLRGPNRLPLIADLDPVELESFASNSVLFDLNTRRNGPSVRFIGTAMAREATVDATRPEAIKILPGTLLGELGCRLPLIAATGAPLDFEAEFLGTEQAPTLYRGVLLPFSAGGNRAAFIYGVVTWKTVAVSLGEDIRSAVGSALSLPYMAPARSPWDEGRPAIEAVALPSRSFAQRLAAAQTWAALARTDHAHRATSLHAALSAAHDFLLAEEEAVGTADEAEAAAVIELVFGQGIANEQRAEFRAVLDQARRLRLGAGTLAALLDRYEDGVAGFLAATPAAPERPSAHPSLTLGKLDSDALLELRPGAVEIARAAASSGLG